MSDKKERILETALELFSKHGFNAVSTSKIAKAASVSEGLIFRHFESKKGLLHAIVKDAELKTVEILSPVLSENDPKKVIQKFIELPFGIGEEEYPYWRLQFKLKWEEEFYNPDKMKPVLLHLTKCFKALAYEKAKLEAELLIDIIDSISINILRKGKQTQKPFKLLLLKKYNI